MCGIAGIFHFDREQPVSPAEIGAMLATIAHRGPDGKGLHIDGNVGLGHRRLSIIDLAGGAQPLSNEDGSVQIVFNGEIYNHELLRRELIAQGHVFRTHSDTEVIVHLYEQLGPDGVRRLDGMFAFAIWDSRRRRLVLARDRVGIKPLYYAQTRDGLIFASELKSILAVSGVRRDLDGAALRRFLAFQYLPGEATLFQSIRKLEPAHYLVAEGGRMQVRRYWDLHFTRSRHALPFAEAVAELRDLVGRTVVSHLMADVPLGVLLSGGVDSSAILSFAAGGGRPPVKTFTLGFSGEGIVDERPYARLVAERFGTEHHELSITADDFWNFLPAYAWHMEEPVCEPPAFALYYISRLASNHVKVLLSGEGGDEAFAGYPNYSHQLRLERIAGWLGPLAAAAGAGVAAAGRWMGSERARRYGLALGRPLAGRYFSRTASPASYFNRAGPPFVNVQLPGSGDPRGYVGELLASCDGDGPLEQMLYIDSKTWLPDDLLVKADKMTMANSVELRVPLLDHHVLEFAASLPPEFKVLGGKTKRVLKAAFSEILPPEILSRRKAGFPVPYGAWLRGPLSGRVRETLLSSRAIGRGYFRANAVEKLLEVHARQGGLGREIFSLLALEHWHQAFADPAASGCAAPPPVDPASRQLQAV